MSGMSCVALPCVEVPYECGVGEVNVTERGRGRRFLPHTHTAPACLVVFGALLRCASCSFPTCVLLLADWLWKLCTRPPESNMAWDCTDVRCRCDARARTAHPCAHRAHVHKRTRTRTHTHVRTRVCCLCLPSKHAHRLGARRPPPDTLFVVLPSETPPALLPVAADVHRDTV